MKSFSNRTFWSNNDVLPNFWSWSGGVNKNFWVGSFHKRREHRQHTENEIHFNRTMHQLTVLKMKSRFKLVSVEKILQKIIHFILFLACLLFTLYQSYMCLVKYQRYPKGTSMKLLPHGKVGNNFPAITFCSRTDNDMELYLGFNQTELKECYGNTDETGK